MVVTLLTTMTNDSIKLCSLNYNSHLVINDHFCLSKSIGTHILLDFQNGKERGSAQSRDRTEQLYEKQIFHESRNCPKAYNKLRKVYSRKTTKP